MATFEQFLSELLDYASAPPSAAVYRPTGNSAHRLELIGRVLASTDRRRRGPQVAIRLQEAAHLSRIASIAGLTCSFAHDLNQPLTAILSNAQAASRLASDEHPDLAEIRAMLDEIASNVIRTSKMIRHAYGLLKDTCESAYPHYTQRSIPGERPIPTAAPLPMQG